MSDPVTNVQIEDVLSSIRRLVSEEIGQQSPKPAATIEKTRDDQKLVLSPAQKIRQDAANQGSDLWEETQALAPQESAPVWWHRDLSEMTSFEASEPMQLGAPVSNEGSSEPTAALEKAQESEPAEESAEVELAVEVEVEAEEAGEPPVAEPEIDEPVKPLEGALAGLEAAKDIHDDEWENPEGEDNIASSGQFDAMPWIGDEEAVEYADHDAKDTSEEIVTEAIVETIKDAVVEATEEERAPFTFRPGERLFERLSSKKMSAESIPEVETVEASPAKDPLDWAADADPEETFVRHSTTTIQDAADEDAFSAHADNADVSNIFDENMLRDLVTDIIRQELQGVLGERITRNVRKLVRREIQRAMSDLNT
ncbi:MAG: hypothetical protein P8L32_02040 [Paracoccaceae bacterium]|nr:hypothetical protein [Paracoccaceae bacterium]